MEDPNADIRKIAEEIYILYAALVAVGFSEEQAFTLVQLCIKLEEPG